MLARHSAIGNVSVASPESPDASLCEAIASDPTLYEHLVRIIKSSGGVELLCWGATPQLYALVERLRSDAGPVSTPDVPPQADAWLVEYLDSKAGFREFCNSLANAEDLPRPPTGYVCPTAEVALSAAAGLTRTGRGIVLKANHGTGGFSVLCYSPSDLSHGWDWIRRNASRRMSFDHFWSAPLVVAEEYVCGPDGGVPQSLTVDLHVSAAGTEIGGVGTMLIRSGTLYAGVTVGLQSVPLHVRAQVVHFADRLGAAVSRMGYRGWIDADFVVDGTDHVIPNEVNARRASPSHALGIARALGGDDWEKRLSVQANDHVKLVGPTPPTYKDLHTLVIRANRAAASRNATVLITMGSSCLARSAPYFGYAVVAPNAPTARWAATAFERLIADPAS